MNKDGDNIEKNNHTPECDKMVTDSSGYFVNIDGEDVEVNVKSDEEYSCLLNCLEGYYVYGIGGEEE